TFLVSAFAFAPAPATSLSSSTATGFSFPTLKPATSTTTVTTTVPSIFGAPTALSSASSVSSAITSAVLSTTTTVTSSGASPATINFRQLEDSINKWKIELEEQEKVFLNQATQVNAWDRLLISNGEKITHLNDAVERVKLDQQRLDLELDFILAQQSELEELLNPLEKSIESTPNIHVQQHADLEREHTYQLAESIDAQLKRMSEDIREIIEHVNTANKAQDDNDPVQQIAKILNAHMDALQWIDQNTVAVQRRLEGVSKLHETQKRESEKTFRGTY
ncbi:nuclear pore glycoprotein p62, partial [Nephila pilipes]